LRFEQGPQRFEIVPLERLLPQELLRAGLEHGAMLLEELSGALERLAHELADGGVDGP
jgi:hypothetical protein